MLYRRASNGPGWPGKCYRSGMRGSMSERDGGVWRLWVVTGHPQPPLPPSGGSDLLRVEQQVGQGRSRLGLAGRGDPGDAGPRHRRPRAGRGDLELHPRAGSALGLDHQAPPVGKATSRGQGHPLSLEGGEVEVPARLQKQPVTVGGSRSWSGVTADFLTLAASATPKPLVWAQRPASKPARLSQLRALG